MVRDSAARTLRTSRSLVGGVSGGKLAGQALDLGLQGATIRRLRRASGRTWRPPSSNRVNHRRAVVRR